MEVLPFTTFFGGGAWNKGQLAVALGEAGGVGGQKGALRAKEEGRGRSKWR